MMRSAADFLPLFMMTFMNLASMSLLNFGSGRMVRTGACERRDISDSLYGLRPDCPHASRSARTANIKKKLHFFGRFAPYLERDCLRSVTPAASNVPRTVW